MIAYLVNQIILGNLTYNEIITKRPDLKVKLDAYIETHNITIDKEV